MGHKQTVVITGASRGIGVYIAEEFAARGYDLALIARSREQLNDVAAGIAAQHPISAKPYVCDIRQAAQVVKTFEAIRADFSSLDVLVNNAGANSRKKMDVIAEAEWTEELETNVTGTFLCAREAARYMKEQKSGAIINISSIKGKEATSSPGYGAAKTAVIGLTRCLAKQLAPQGIRVNCVAPGFIDIGMTKLLSAEEAKKYLAMIPCARFGAPEEVAKVVAFLASAEASYIIGATIDVNGGYLM